MTKLTIQNITGIIFLTDFKEYINKNKLIYLFLQIITIKQKQNIHARTETYNRITYLIIVKDTCKTHQKQKIAILEVCTILGCKVLTSLVR